MRRRRKPTQRERFDTLAMEYGSKVELARSIASSTGQSARTVLRHFKEGKTTAEENRLLKRREKYTYKEAPRKLAKRISKDLQKRGKVVGGYRIGKYNEDTGRFSGKNILASDVLQLNGLQSMFVGDFTQALAQSELEGIDLWEDQGKFLIFTLQVFPKDGPSKVPQVYSYRLPISNELPADIYEIFRKLYKDGSEDAIFVF